MKNIIEVVDFLEDEKYKARKKLLMCKDDIIRKRLKKNLTLIKTDLKFALGEYDKLKYLITRCRINGYPVYSTLVKFQNVDFL